MYAILIIFLLSACSNEESIQKDNIHAENISNTEDEVLPSKNMEIPNTIFTSKKTNSVIDKKEIKQSIKIYLDSSDELFNISNQFEEILDEDQELSKSELEKFDKINKLVKENDENFSKYILNNTLPEGYQKESERISNFITASNQYLHKLNETLDNLIDDVSEGRFSEIDFDSLKYESHLVNGKQQKKIEEFLDRENIQTKAFGRDIKK